MGENPVQKGKTFWVIIPTVTALFPVYPLGLDDSFPLKDLVPRAVVKNEERLDEKS